MTAKDPFKLAYFAQLKGSFFVIFYHSNDDLMFIKWN